MSPKVRANIVPAIPLCKNRTGKTAYLPGSVTTMRIDKLLGVPIRMRTEDLPPPTPFVRRAVAGRESFPPPPEASG